MSKVPLVKCGDRMIPASSNCMAVRNGKQLTTFAVGDKVKIIAAAEDLPQPQYLYAGREAYIEEISSKYVYLKADTQTKNGQIIPGFSEAFYPEEIEIVQK